MTAYSTNRCWALVSARAFETAMGMICSMGPHEIIGQGIPRRWRLRGVYPDPTGSGVTLAFEHRDGPLWKLGGELTPTPCIGEFTTEGDCMMGAPTNAARDLHDALEQLFRQPTEGSRCHE